MDGWGRSIGCLVAERLQMFVRIDRTAFHPFPRWFCCAVPLAVFGAQITRVNGESRLRAPRGGAALGLAVRLAHVAGTAHIRPGAWVRHPALSFRLRTLAPSARRSQTMSPSSSLALAETRAWVDRAVIGLNLCPFAKAPQMKGQVRYVVSEATDPAALLGDLVAELELLAEAPADRTETTLLIHPLVLQDFMDFNGFLEIAEDTLAELDLDGDLQVASFHPGYQFADAAPDDIGNATNRSPYPTLHLIREASIDRAVAAFPEAQAIYETNIATLEKLGPDGWAALQQQCRNDAAAG